MKRYAVESAGPDKFTSWPECFGPDGKRGRVHSEHDALEEAIQACDGMPEDHWIWDRRARCFVSESRIKKAQESD